MFRHLVGPPPGFPRRTPRGLFGLLPGGLFGEPGSLGLSSASVYALAGAPEAVRGVSGRCLGGLLGLLLPHALMVVEVLLHHLAQKQDLPSLSPSVLCEHLLLVVHNALWQLALSMSGELGHTLLDDLTA